MQKDERFLPRRITRFNYWTFFPPVAQHWLTPTTQRLDEFPDIAWVDRPGHTAAHRHNQQTFLLLKQSANSPGPLFDALKGYVEDDKEWRSDRAAQGALRQLSSQQRAAINRLANAKWPERSTRPARLIRTWDNLFREIARDVDIFERFCDVPPAADEMSGTPKRIYLSYRNQAIKLLGGGGTYIPPGRQRHYQGLLNARGRLDSPSIFKDVDWLKLARQDRREAEKRTLHWFRHALRNLREYRNRRLPIPWTDECEKTCSDIQKKLLIANS